MTSFAPKVSTPVADKDVAETFGESDIVLTQSNTTTESESVRLVDEDTSESSRPADDTSATGTYSRGVRINPNADLTAIEGTISANTSDCPGVEIYNVSTGDLLASKSGPFSAGDVVRLDVDLTSGQAYNFVPDGSAEFTDGYYGGSTSYPYSSQYVDIVNGALGSDSTLSEPYCFGSVTGVVPDVKLSGSVTVEWPMPSDVYAWDTGVYQATPDGATVEVYVEEDQSGGWTEIAGPISRGDSIDADPENNVRYRVEFSRPDGNSAPSLDAIYRRWKL